LGWTAPSGDAAPARNASRPAPNPVSATTATAATINLAFFHIIAVRIPSMRVRTSGDAPAPPAALRAVAATRLAETAAVRPCLLKRNRSRSRARDRRVATVVVGQPRRAAASALVSPCK